MKKLFIAAFIFVSTFTTNTFADIKMGIILGFTGPIESLTPAMRDSAKIAFKEASDSGALLGGEKITVIEADSTCTDSAAATTAAEGLVAAGVTAIMGADCSGVTGAIITGVAVPNGIVMISPSATSPGLTDAKDKKLFFRTAPSDARGGAVLAQVTKDRGMKSVSVTYTNNDYGKGLADVYAASAKKLGIKINVNTSHEDGKADYSAEVGVLAAAGGDALVVLGYVDQGGQGIIQTALDTGAFSTFVLSDGMYGSSLTEKFGTSINGSFGSMPGSLGDGANAYKEMAKAAGINEKGPFIGESYDAAALIVLAMQSGKSADSKKIKKHILKVANAPGTKIYPGELKKGLELLAKGEKIDYEGATDVVMTKKGDAMGAFKEFEIQNGAFVDIKQR